MAISLFEGPIPGENYTSDTKNYPWHRPPEITDLDQAIELIAKRVFSEPLCFNIITMLELGAPVISVSGMMLMQGISAGKWTVDYAILLSGPTCHIIQILAESYGIKYNMGLEFKHKYQTKDFFKMANDFQAAKSMGDQIRKEMGITEEPTMEESESPQSGFMNMGKEMIASEGQEAEQGQPEDPNQIQQATGVPMNG